MNKVTVTEKNFQIQIGSIRIYKCPNCNGNDLKTHYKHCPHCGITLRFKTSEHLEQKAKDNEISLSHMS